jgi:hypothetical protein
MGQGANMSRLFPISVSPSHWLLDITIPKENKDTFFSSTQRVIMTFSSTKERVTKSLGQWSRQWPSRVVPCAIYWWNEGCGSTTNQSIEILLGDGYGLKIFNYHLMNIKPLEKSCSVAREGIHKRRGGILQLLLKSERGLTAIGLGPQPIHKV